MRRITLIIKNPKDSCLPIEAEGISPNNLSNKIDITVFVGNEKKNLVDVFDIRVDGEAAGPSTTEIVMVGDCSRVKRVGEYMTNGKITVEGNIGMHCGDFMSGGTIEINGNAGDWLGREMVGGEIICHGNAGNYCGSGYRGGRKGVRGGSITVEGSVGDYCGEAQYGGIIHILGNAGLHAGCNVKKGELIIDGDCTMPGGDMIGGVITVFGTVYDFLPTFEETDKVIENGKELTVFVGDLANIKAKGKLRVGKYIRI